MKKVAVEKKVLQVPQKRFPVLTIILFLAYLALTLGFFFVLDSQTHEGFGLGEIIFSVVISFFLMLIFAWCKSLERKNPYLGLIISLVVIGLLIYVINIYYQGIYTTSFMAAGGIITIAYMLYYLIRYRIAEKQDQER